jgi:hypothetical protein
MQIVSTNTATIGIDAFSSGFSGRAYRTVSTLTVGVWQSVYIVFDNSKTSEFDSTGSNVDAKLRIAVNGVFQAVSAVDLGAGGAPSALQSATGTGSVGAASDSDTPVAPMLNGSLWGPDTYVGNGSLTQAELNVLHNFELPT